MEVPGIRRVRSDDLPRLHRDLGPVRSQHRHPAGPAAGAEPRGRAARRPAGGDRADRRAADPVRVPHPQLQPHGRPARGRPARLRVLRRCGRRWRACPGVGRVEVRPSDTREIEVVTSTRARLLASGLTVPRRGRRAQGREPAHARRPAIPSGGHAVPRARLRPVDVGGRHRADAGRRSRAARPSAWPTSATSSRARPTAPRS